MFQNSVYSTVSGIVKQAAIPFLSPQRRLRKLVLLTTRAFNDAKYRVLSLICHIDSRLYRQPSMVPYNFIYPRMYS